MSHGKAAAPVGVFALLAAAVLSGQEIEFNRDIRPILSDQCFACHGPDAAKRKTKLRFDTEAGARIELAQGRFAIVPGDPERSELVRRVASPDTAVRMPPAYAGRAPLKAAEIDRIRRWIAQGARWQPFWSFIPPRRPASSPGSRRRIGCAIRSTASFWPASNAKDCTPPPRPIRRRCCAA